MSDVWFGEWPSLAIRSRATGLMHREAAALSRRIAASVARFSLPPESINSWNASTSSKIRASSNRRSGTALLFTWPLSAGAISWPFTATTPLARLCLRSARLCRYAASASQSTSQFKISRSTRTVPSASIIKVIRSLRLRNGPSKAVWTVRVTSRSDAGSKFVTNEIML